MTSNLRSLLFLPVPGKCNDSLDLGAFHYRFRF